MDQPLMSTAYARVAKPSGIEAYPKRYRTYALSKPSGIMRGPKRQALWYRSVSLKVFCFWFLVDLTVFLCLVSFCRFGRFLVFGRFDLFLVLGFWFLVSVCRFGWFLVFGCFDRLLVLGEFLPVWTVLGFWFLVDLNGFGFLVFDRFGRFGFLFLVELTVFFCKF
jgi:hypothetical protein